MREAQVVRPRYGLRFPQQRPELDLAQLAAVGLRHEVLKVAA